MTPYRSWFGQFRERQKQRNHETAIEQSAIVFRPLKANGELPLSLRPIRTSDFSVSVQVGGRVTLPAHYEMFHVVAIPLSGGHPLVRGEGAARRCFRIDGDEVAVHPAGPGELVQWPRDARCVYVHVHHRFLASLTRTGGGSVGVSLAAHDHLRDAVLRDIGLALVEQIASRARPETIAVCALMHSLVDRLTARYLVPNSGASPSGIATALDRLRVDGREAGPISALAQEYGLTRSHFSRRFRTITRLSPYAMLAASRIERAKFLLTTEERSIAETAYLCGFVDQSHLNRAFRAAVHRTPREFVALSREVRRGLFHPH